MQALFEDTNVSVDQFDVSLRLHKRRDILELDHEKQDEARESVCVCVRARVCVARARTHTHTHVRRTRRHIHINLCTQVLD